MKKIQKKIQILAVALFMALASASALSPLAYATTPTTTTTPASDVTSGMNATGASRECDHDNKKDTPKQPCKLTDDIKTVTGVLMFIIGAISVIMIIIGGIRYVISNGDSSQISAAKNTIFYSVIGLVVALLAYAVVEFIINQFAR